MTKGELIRCSSLPISEDFDTLPRFSSLLESKKCENLQKVHRYPFRSDQPEKDTILGTSNRTSQYFPRWLRRSRSLPEQISRSYIGDDESSRSQQDNTRNHSEQRLSVEEIKKKWRNEQIANQQKFQNRTQNSFLSILMSLRRSSSATFCQRKN